MHTELNIVGIIPARYSSTRLEGKPLKKINGKTLIQHVWERCILSSRLSKVIVATDDKRIEETVKAFGGEVIITSKDHITGTDRISEVAARIDADLIVNIQGDEPLIRAEIIDQAVEPFITDKSVQMGTICSLIKSEEELNDLNVVKVVIDKGGFAIYFSRFPIPFVRDSIRSLHEDAPIIKGGVSYYKHIGLYVYSRDFLLLFSKLPASPLEKAEKLEQLRALENGHKIKVVVTQYDSMGVDTPEDLEKLRSLLNKP